MSSRWWTIFLTALVVGFSDVKSESTAFPEIPKHLLECYMNDGIYHRANRIPNSYESFLDLIRKIEDSPTGRNINARELSLVLLHYLKLDGIQSVQSQARASSNIVPFAPAGDEYFKHRLTLIGLVPKIDQNYLSAVNESLTQKELCNLHFMLSYSIDPYKRENERCSPLYENVNSHFQGFHGEETKFDWNPYQTIPGYHHNLGRIRRDQHEGKRRHAGKALHKNKWSLREESDLSEYLKKGKQERKMTKRRADDKKADVEIISVHDLKSKAKNRPEVTEKDKFTIGSQELLGDSEIHPKNLQSLVQVRPTRYGGRPPYSRAGYGSEDGFTYSGIIPGMQMSDCPAVNGIITTPFGSLAIGTVMAGIAAGLNPEDIPPVKLSVSPSDLENQMDRVNNVWATTLAGTVADTLSSSVLLGVDNLQILKGGWNESTTPRWYLLKNNQFNHLTEVSLRGSLDGLFLGLSAKELTNKFSNFKLSQLLQIYYEYSWGEIGAKNRVTVRPQYAPDETFKKQVHLMSLVLKRQKTNVLTVLNFDLISRDAVSRISNFIQNMDDKNSEGKTQNGNIDVAMNMVAVIDSGWGHDSLNKVFESLRAAKLAATPHQSNLTLVCGNDGRFLLNAENSLDLSRTFTREMLFENCTRGMNFLAVFDALEFFYRKLYKEEETSNKVNGDSQVLIFFPYDTFVQENHEDVVLRSREFQHTFPDVRLVIAANGRSDAYDLLVKDQRNLFAVVPSTVDPDSKSLKDLVEGIKQSYQRISRPSCGSYFDDESQGSEIRMTKEVFPGDIVYFRLLPQYYFRSYGDVVVTVRSKQRVPLTVCHSREVERPEDVRKKSGLPPRTNPGPPRNHNFNPEYSYGKQMNEDVDGPVQCKTITSETYRIELNYPCYSAYSLAECQPLYISIQPPQQSISIICPNCRMPLNVQSEISVVGLTCYNAARSLLFSPLTLILSLFFTFLTNFLVL